LRNNLYILIILGCCSSFIVKAQDSVRIKNKKSKESFISDSRHWRIEIPFWIPGFQGALTYGDVELEGEDGPIMENPIEPDDPGNIFSRLFKTNGKLNYFVVGSVAYHNKKIHGELEFFSGTVGSSINFRYNNKELVKAKFHTDLVRLYAGYKFYESPVFSE